MLEEIIRVRRLFDPHLIKLLIFDLDGTLIDSRLDLVHSVNASLRQLGRPELAEDLIASYVGWRPADHRTLGDANDETLARRGLDTFCVLQRPQTRPHSPV